MSTDDSTTQHNGVLFILAHPDDEAFGLSGTIMLLRRRGIPVTLVTATRGEVGEILAPERATRETLGAVREQELRAAMSRAGLEDVRVLGYRDSGMDGTPENADPRNLVQAPEAEVVAHLVAAIRSVRPAAVVTFAEDGGYGHPDHVAIHFRTLAAVAAAADPEQPAGLGDAWRVGALYVTAMPRERLQQMARRAEGPFRSLTPEQIATLGTPLAEITITLPISDVVDDKLAVLREHLTQVGPKGPFSDLPPELVRTMMGWEFLRAIDLPWPTAPSDPLRELFAERRPDPATVNRDLATVTDG